MAKTYLNSFYDSNGQLIRQETVEVPDDKIDLAIAALQSIDPTAITTLAQAKAALVLHHRILKYLVPHVILANSEGDPIP